jgi:hypothetical protein
VRRAYSRERDLGPIRRELVAKFADQGLKKYILNSFLLRFAKVVQTARLDPYGHRLVLLAPGPRVSWGYGDDTHHRQRCVRRTVIEPAHSIKSCAFRNMQTQETAPVNFGDLSIARDMSGLSGTGSVRRSKPVGGPGWGRVEIHVSFGHKTEMHLTTRAYDRMARPWQPTFEPFGDLSSKVLEIAPPLSANGIQEFGDRSR